MQIDLDARWQANRRLNEISQISPEIVGPGA
jgi:hypothetical protein